MREGKKLIYHQLKTDETEYYDLLADPKELHNLAGERPEDVNALLTDLMRMNALSAIMPGMTPTDWGRAKKLKSLGYVR